LAGTRNPQYLGYSVSRPARYTFLSAKRPDPFGLKTLSFTVLIAVANRGIRFLEISRHEKVRMIPIGGCRHEPRWLSSSYAIDPHQFSHAVLSTTPTVLAQLVGNTWTPVTMIGGFKNRFNLPGQLAIFLRARSRRAVSVLVVMAGSHIQSLAHLADREFRFMDLHKSDPVLFVREKMLKAFFLNVSLLSHRSQFLAQSLVLFLQFTRRFLRIGPIEALQMFSFPAPQHPPMDPEFLGQLLGRLLPFKQ
jgi:hypothetical protein